MTDAWGRNSRQKYEFRSARSSKKISSECGGIVQMNSKG